MSEQGTGETDPSGPPGDQPSAGIQGRAGAELEETHEFTPEEEVVLAELLDELPENSPLREHVISLFEMYSGPLPDAAMLEAYKRVDPRVVDEVLEEAKVNRQHRIKMDRWLIVSARLSLLATTLVILATIGAVVFLGVAGQPVLAGVFGAGGLATIVGFMIRGGGAWDGRGGHSQ